MILSTGGPRLIAHEIAPSAAGGPPRVLHAGGRRAPARGLIERIEGSAYTFAGEGDPFVGALANDELNFFVTSMFAANTFGADMLVTRTSPSPDSRPGPATPASPPPRTPPRKKRRPGARATPHRPNSRAVFNS